MKENQKENNTLCRFGILFLLGLLGVFILYIFNNCFFVSCLIQECLKIEKNSRLISSIQLLLLGLPIAIGLWVFRNRDKKEQIEQSYQQIEKSNKQIEKSNKQIEQSIITINQNKLFNALEDFTSDDILKIEIATQSLINLSKNFNIFDDEIKLAFIKRLKHLPESLNSKKIKLTYAQYILNWLADYQEKNKDKKLDLIGCDFSYQQFSKKTNFDIFRNNLNKFYNVNFYQSNLSNTNLKETILKIVNFDEANLMNADLTEANIRIDQQPFSHDTDIESLPTSVVNKSEPLNAPIIEFQNGTTFKGTKVAGAIFRKTSITKEYLDKQGANGTSISHFS